MDSCIFCRIIERKIPAYILYEDSSCVAFLDASQATPGHTLIVPKTHTENFLLASSETLTHLINVANKIGVAIQKSNPKILGMNLLSNCGPIAGQTVPHLHIHLIPRYQQDDITISWVSHFGAISPETFEVLQQNIQKNLQL